MSLPQFSRRWVISAAGVVASLGSHAAFAAQTKSFVVSWFLQAANSYEGDCPDGINPLPEDMFRIELRGIGMPEAQIEELVGGVNGGNASDEVEEALVNRGRHNGKPMNAYTYPDTVPDVGFHEVKGKYAFGFNLDGKQSPTNYEDPETHETGVDNQYWRAMGCNINHRGTPKERPAEWSLHWELNRNSMPAWLISITTEDFAKDGDVTVNLYKALERVARDANGYVRRDFTFRIDPDPRWQNTLRGKIEDGMITISNPHEVHLSGDPYMLTELDMTQARLRMKLNPEDGTVEGILGGYIPWQRVLFIYGSSGWNSETMLGTDIPGAFHALRRHADAFPDPKTGRNTAISTAFRIVGVPAYVVRLDAQK